MQLSFVGEPDLIELDFCREAIRYFGKRLLSRRTYKSVKIKVVFATEGLEHSKATCAWNDRPRYSRDFTIQVNPTLGSRTVLLSLAHEMVHIKQYATGELQDYLTNVHKSKWRGKIYYCYTDEDYWLYSPWEFDAFGREIGLYKTFMESCLCRT